MSSWAWQGLDVLLSVIKSQLLTNKEFWFGVKSHWFELVGAWGWDEFGLTGIESCSTSRRANLVFWRFLFWLRDWWLVGSWVRSRKSFWSQAGVQFGSHTEGWLFLFVNESFVVIKWTDRCQISILSDWFASCFFTEGERRRWLVLKIHFLYVKNKI